MRSLILTAFLTMVLSGLGLLSGMRQAAVPPLTDRVEAGTR
ncbi:MULTISPECIES: hypothetical protein [unclassified Caulobacter]|jgi:hypothetical protein|nr:MULTISPECIES: hypothetical protein [unclassified Caulobacter]